MRGLFPCHDPVARFSRRFLHASGSASATTDVATTSSRLVCKFGGTSMATGSSVAAVVSILKSQPNSLGAPPPLGGPPGSRRGVVVSAPGKRWKGDVKCTDLLLKIFAAGENKMEKEDLVEEVLQRFRGILENEEALGAAARGGTARGGTAGSTGASTSSSSSSDPKLRHGSLWPEFERTALQILDSKSQDFIVSRGEYLAGLTIARLLNWQFLDPAEAVFLKEANIDLDYTMDAIKANTSSTISGSPGHDSGVVMPGFFGTDRSSRQVVALPRGGSDISGALLATALHADEYENWTDVDGVFTADPNRVKGAAKISLLNFSELRCLAELGAQVLHPATLDYCGGGMPIHLRNTFRPEREGTRIVPGNGRETGAGPQAGVGGTAGVLGLVVSEPSTLLVVGAGAEREQERVRDAVLSVVGARSLVDERRPSGAGEPWWFGVGLSGKKADGVATAVHERLVEEKLFRVG